MSDQSDLDGIELQASHGTRHSARHDFPQPKSGLLAAGGLWRAIWLAGGIGWLVANDWTIWLVASHGISRLSPDCIPAVSRLLPGASLNSSDCLFNLIGLPP